MSSGAHLQVDEQRGLQVERGLLVHKGAAHGADALERDAQVRERLARAAQRREAHREVVVRQRARLLRQHRRARPLEQRERLQKHVLQQRAHAWGGAAGVRARALRAERAKQGARVMRGAPARR